MKKSDITGKNVTILGSQRSAMGAARLLRHFGAKVLVSEFDADKFSADKRQVLADIEAEFEFGYHSPDVLASDLVVVSPGIPENADIIQKIRSKNIPIYSEIEMTSWFIEAPIIAVTGSNGKTTTVNLIHHLLQTAGYDSFLGGNVGVAASEVLLGSLKRSSDKPVFVLEVSSFQLDNIDTFKPQVAVILNLTPDHLDRYVSLTAYYESKLGILNNLDENCTAVLNRDDPELSNQDINVDNSRYFSVSSPSGGDAMLAEGILGMMREGEWSPILPAKALPLPGKHNLSNALAAIASVMDFISDPEILAQGLMTFSAVPHRIEYVGKINGIRCFNDSKATNIASTEVAIHSFPEPLWLILGGKDKGGDFSTLISQLEESTREVLLVGAASDIIETQISPALPTRKLENIESAINYCLENGTNGDVLLLSPACASFDQFENFEARGDHFRTLIQTHEGWSM
ncbi:MAG: UDP-N-acetylmuramoyl-L-alanine--D-glutamate ligase [Candidatus Marinimicrobia bacterium]|jgi:UDP-N-acetylmuramoylalanine--D-glutamate ligase|nr:UDP-N-acetylmuramoyl-L-alanine--D-glutamate ligase [Candidatus Neomarinimicrobiota bacterium]MBT3632470.1 UDP-N-acetylmuramoyl-L-alanine--D-glutamate ligase [Candidatus Neomarinimicrobiota bacterium]MBT3825363.1 UDP-N-acetylmuramoyl-L-alanine--D-glutamate ligase [Candidatus Neomarinimicrobiota bacterium]MBT4132690.1 UDP-N-acetylmuramoyl-L-alanine--D-glutamate ligase [Candidatus Neomarinimicrobiota bacterium]MBT4296517.1 UDP-N-acetylmuramoyl-L-alanine--D-glutamate ligase [Candidatus Neomarini